MKIFTGVDKALLQRGARLLEAQAKSLEKATTAGGSWAGKRKEKMAFDALLRDARDLRTLGARLARPAPGPAMTPAETEDLRGEVLRASSPEGGAREVIGRLWRMAGLGDLVVP